jgi:predicted PurR-regulated permease PerM
MTLMSGSSHERADPAARPTGAARALAIVVGVVLVVAALKLAKSVLVPLAAGLFLAVLARPLHLRLRRPLPRLLRWLALVATMLVVLAGVAAFVVALGMSARAVTEELQGRRPAIASGLAGLREAAARVGLPLPEPGATERRSGPADAGGGAGGDAAPVGSSGTSFAADAARALLTTLAGLGLALAFAALGLAEADDARRRLAHLGRGGAGALAVIDETAPAFRRYVWVKSLTSAITGTGTALVALAFGLPLAWVWGFIAFLFEFVPTVGSLLAVVPPTLMALAVGGPTLGLAVLLAVGTLQIVFGNVVDPRIEGRLMAVSPFGVLLSIVFWGWMWGAVGALLAVPLTVAVVIACRHIPGARGVATLVAGDGVPESGRDRSGEG